MSCHLYCVRRRVESPEPEMPPGVGGERVCLVSHANLSVAVSPVSRAGQETLSDLSGIRAHSRVVAFFNRSRTVIPLRYGCRLADEAQVAGLLRDRGPHYEALFQELDGCVEMGLRLLVPEEPSQALAAGDPESLKDGAPSPTGLAYLQARQAHYDRQEEWSREQRHRCQEVTANFAGLFTKVKTEGPFPRLPLLSVYFLVPRIRVAEFRQSFRRFSRQTEARLLLSGPWPPYNFAVDEAENPLNGIMARPSYTGW
jgi:hypothetical protein